MNSVRLSAFRKEATHFYSEMTGTPQNVSVKISPLPDIIHTSLSHKTLLIHPLFLLSPEDFPTHLRVSGPEDAKIRSSRYFSSLQKWLSREFHIQKSHLLGLEKKLLFHVHLWKRPAMIDRIKRFAIAHEIAHLALRHKQGTWDWYVSLAVSVIATIALFALLPFAISVFLSMLATYSAFRFFAGARALLEKNDEIEADRAAVKATKDIEAAKACFAVLKEYQDFKWKNASLTQKMLTFLFRTEEILPISHPTPQSRTTYLTEALFL